jgi:hypothetical protein
MRTYRNVTTLSLSLLLGACSGRQQQTADLPDDLRKDLAAASVGRNELASAPQSQKRVRFVSDLEQWKGGAPKRAMASHHPTRPMVHKAASAPTTDMATSPAIAVASEASAPTSIAVAPAPEPTAVIAASPSAEPSSAPAGSTSDSGAGDRGRGGGWGGLLGGIIGTVVLRGGHGGIDKCDTRTAGRGRGQPPATDEGEYGRGRSANGRPDFGLPLPTGGVFSGGRRR